ncbi:ABC transporter permease [Spirillospora sp. NPDC049652]
MTAATVRWTLLDAWTMTGRELERRVRRPGALVAALAFPVMVVLMMGYLFGGQMDAPGGNYREFIMPGMFALTMAFGLEGTFTAIAADASRGITDRFRALPLSASAPVAGRCAADLVDAVLGLVVMGICGLAVGWRWHDGIARALAAFGLLVLLRASLVWAGVWLGLLAKGPESVMVIQVLVWPVGFLSSALVDPSTMPGWLGAVAEWNPLSATVTACRDLFGQPGWESHSWPGRHALALAVAWPLVITAVSLPLAVRRYRRLG